jgi:hypothetical protein
MNLQTKAGGLPVNGKGAACEATPKQDCNGETVTGAVTFGKLFPFVRGGFEHKLIGRLGTLCLVERSRNGVTHYEVVVLHWEPEKHFPNGYVTPAHWSYPASEQWGERGWTYSYTDLAGAHRKYVEVAQKRGLNRFPSIRTLDRAQNAPRRCVPTVSRQRTDKETL